MRFTRSVVAVVVGVLASAAVVAVAQSPRPKATDKRAPKAARGAPAAKSGAKSGVPSTDWTRFRGSDGSGTSRESGLPTTWSPTENIAWKTPLPGAGTSSPIVIGDRIYLTCYRGFGVPGESPGGMDDLVLSLVCLNRADGSVRWEKTIEPKLPEQETIRDEHGYSSSTPVADNDRVYIFLGKTGVFAFTHAGDQVWRADVGSRLNGWGSAASPVLFGDLLLVNASVESESVVALDKATGKERWRATGIKEAWNTPLVVTSDSGNSELVVPIFRQILGLDPATGDKLWSCNTDINWYMVPSPVTDGTGTVYCIGGRSGGAVAVRTGGRGDVTSSHRVWLGGKGSNVSSPIFKDGHLYWIHDQLGIAFCANAATGELIYQERLQGADQVYASALLADGKLYYVSRRGRTFVVAAKPQFELLATNDLEERGRFDASPAVADGRLLIRSNRFLYSIGTP